MISMYAVRLSNGGYEFFLRKTIWTSTIERASMFSTEDDARAALLKAKQFMARKSDARRAEIILVNTAEGTKA
jgi:hypothetical protein